MGLFRVNVACSLVAGRSILAAMTGPTGVIPKSGSRFSEKIMPNRSGTTLTGARSNSMSAQRVPLQQRNFPARLPLRLVGAIALLALPLAGRGTGALWDKVPRKGGALL